MHEKVIATIPQGEKDSLLEVVLIQTGPDDSRIELRHHSWGEGIGWYRQHTLTLDAATVRALGRTLSQVQQRLDHGLTARHSSKVIPFPSLGQR